MTKQELRNFYKSKRSQLSKSEKEQLEKSIYQQVFALDFTPYKVFHIFLTLEKFNEINTQPIIDYLSLKNKKIVISKSNFEDNSLLHYYLEKDTPLVTNKYGIPEPVNAKKAAIESIDFVFVPLLISDEQHFRVGYGKGFYDKFLACCNSDTKKVGLNFFKPIPKIEDINSFDIALDKVIYPK